MLHARLTQSHNVSHSILVCCNCAISISTSHQQRNKVTRERIRALLPPRLIQQLALPPPIRLRMRHRNDVARGKAELVRVGRLVVVQRLDVEQYRLACIAVLTCGRVALRCCGRRRRGGSGSGARGSTPLLLLCRRLVVRGCDAGRALLVRVADAVGPRCGCDWGAGGCCCCCRYSCMKADAGVS